MALSAEASVTTPGKALEFKGRMMTLTVVRVQQPDLDAIESQLKAQIERAPGFFKGLPLLLELADESVDLNALVALLRRYELTPVALHQPSETAAKSARDAGLGVFGQNRPMLREAPPPEPEEEPAPKQEAPPPVPAFVAARAPAKIISQPVRSGQQIYAKNADLVVLSSVGAGAEVIADGCIHVYGALRGRAIAGAQGDTQARIICQQMGAELVSVAGTYKISEDIKETVRGRSVQVYLDNGALKIEKLSKAGD
jgi:septum site-determining protein MinC